MNSSRPRRPAGAAEFAMAQSDRLLTEVLSKIGATPYRSHIEYLLREYSTQVLQQRATAGIGVVAEVVPELAAELQPALVDFIDHINARYGTDRHFWQTATVEEAAWAFIEEGIVFLPTSGVLSRKEDALIPGRNQQLAYVLYQVPTMSFAYSASTQRAQRKFMGIRKGLFG